MTNDFKFVVPLDVYKSEEENEWKIRGLASTEDIDSQRETIIQKGLDISHLKSGLGLFNYDHGQSPEDIVGQITDAEQKEEGLFVEGYLFKHQAKAKALNNILKSLKKGHEKRLKMSIEGKVLKRKGNKIEKAKIMNVALTLNPINGSTYAEFAKSFAKANEECPPNDPCDSSEGALTPSGVPSSTYNLEKSLLELDMKLDDVIERLEKAISAPAGDMPADQKTQGAALAKESLEKKLKNLTAKVLKMNPEMDYKSAAKVALIAINKKNKSKK